MTYFSNHSNRFLKKCQKTLKNAFFFDLEKKAFIFIISLLCAKIEFFNVGGLLALPTLGFAYALGSPYLALSVFAILIGSLSNSLYQMLFSAAVTAGFIFLMQSLKIFKNLKLTERTLISVIITDLSIRFAANMLNNNSSFIFLPLITAIFTFWLTYFYLLSAYQFHIRYQKIYRPEYILFLSFIITLAGFGIPNINNTINWQLIIISFIGLFLLKTAGLGMGLTYTVLASLAHLAFYSNNTMMLILIAPIAFVSIVKEFPKLTISFFYISIYYLAAEFQGIEILLNWKIINAVIPVVIFLFLDNRLIKNLSKKMPGQKEAYRLQKENFQGLKGKIAGKVLAYSELFEKVSHELIKSDHSKQMREVIGDIYRSICINCPKSKMCYQEASNELISIIPKAVIKKITMEEAHYIEDNCLKPAKFLTQIEEHKRNYFAEYKYNQEYNRLKGLITNQLKTVSRFLYNCQEEIIQESDNAQETAEEKIKALLESMQYDVLYLAVKQDNLGKITIYGSISKINQKILNEAIIPLISAELKIEIRLVKGYLTGFDSYYRFELESTKNYIITYGISQVGKNFEYCGDTYRMFNSLNETVIALSDGMGAGKSAADESKFTIEILEKMLKSGISTGEAIENLNALLKIKNRYDTYATLDIMSFNNRTGEAVFTKTGAYPSYLVRQNKVSRIDNATVPVGIIDNVEANSKLISLEDGDIVVMMSDGVDEYISDDIDDILININQKDPQLYSSELLKKCHSNKRINDDITIIIAKVACR